MIHYHGTPFSGDESVQAKSLIGRHAMVSFATPGHLPLISEVCQSFCLDNGAFSAWKREHTPDWEAYAEWVDEWSTHPCFDFYVIPDVIDGDYTENLKLIGKWNGMVKRSMLIHGAPVWHMHEPLEVLRDFCGAFYRVCIGSSGEYATVGTSAWWNRMAEAMSICCDENGRPRCKLHGLRMLDARIFTQLPLSSADSTNVARNIGIDSKWTGSYQPASKSARALVMMERIEKEQCASKWQHQVQERMF